MKKLLTLSLSLIAVLSANAGWTVINTWDFAELQTKNDDKTKVPTTGSTQTFGGTACDLGDDWADGLAFQGASGWILYTTGGLYNSNAGGRRMAITEVKNGQRITISTNDSDGSNLCSPVGATQYNYSNGTYTYDVSEGGSFYVDVTRYYTIYSITISTYEKSDDDKEVTYTVKYVDGDNNEIKDSVTRTSVEGEDITLLGSDTSDFWTDNNSTKYIYDSNDLGSQTASDNLVITCKFHKAADVTYTVNATYDNSTFKTLASGTNVENEVISFAFSAYYLLDNGTFLSHAAISNDYHSSITLGSESTQNETFAYTNSNITNVVFFSEGEDIDGMTKANPVPTRCSMEYGGYAADNVTITKLAPGKYYMFASTRSLVESDALSFTINESEVASAGFTKGNTLNTTSEAFNVTEDVELIMAIGGSASSVLDYLYIVKTGNAEIELTEGEDYTMEADLEVESVSIERNYTDTTWHSLYLPFPVSTDAVGGEVAELTNINYDGNDEITLYWDTLSGTVAANTPCIVKPENGQATTIKAENVTMAKAEEKSISKANNNLTVTLTGNYSNKQQSDIDGTAYVLNNDCFKKLSDTGSLASYRIYLTIDNQNDSSESASAAPGKAGAAQRTYTVRNVINGEVSGIQSVTVEPISDGVYYNLQGQRVENPSAGQIYIINGKKVVK